jgi:hypothetical protein
VCDLESGKPQWPSNLGRFPEFWVIMVRIAFKVCPERPNALLASPQSSPTSYQSHLGAISQDQLCKYILRLTTTQLTYLQDRVWL